MHGTAISITDCCYKDEFSVEFGDLLKEPKWLLLQCQRKIYGKHDQMHFLLNGLCVLDLLHKSERCLSLSLWLAGEGK